MNLKGQKILVTGGAGFIGSHVVESLVAQGAFVTVYDNLNTGKEEYLSTVKDKIEFVKGDILDYKSLKRASKGVKLISHHAAQLEIFKSIEEPVSDLKTNTIGTLNVLRLAKEIGAKRVINISSVSVYGQAVKVPESESHPTDPNWAYGVSKLAAEKYCQIYQEQYKIPIVSLRYGQVYGVREWFGRVLSVFIKRILDRQPLVIFGDGSRVRDLVYVSDVVNCHNLCLKNDRFTKGVLNVGSGEVVTIIELARKVLRVFGSNQEIIYDNPKEGEISRYIPYRRRIPCELIKMAMDIKKAKKVLGWQPKVTLEEGIRKTAQWVMDNPGVWQVRGMVNV